MACCDGFPPRSPSSPARPLLIQPRRRRRSCPPRTSSIRLAIPLDTDQKSQLRAGDHLGGLAPWAWRNGKGACHTSGRPARGRRSAAGNSSTRRGAEMQKIETFDRGATKPWRIGLAARRGSLHHAMAQPLFPPLKNQDQESVPVLQQAAKQPASITPLPMK